MARRAGVIGAVAVLPRHGTPQAEGRPDEPQARGQVDQRLDQRPAAGRAADDRDQRGDGDGVGKDSDRNQPQRAPEAVRRAGGGEEGVCRSRQGQQSEAAGGEGGEPAQPSPRTCARNSAWPSAFAAAARYSRTRPS